MLKIAHHPIYKYELPEGHRFPMVKYDLLPEQLLRENIIESDHFFSPKRLDWEDILLTHTEDYCHKLQMQTLSSKEVRNIGFPMRDDLVERGRYIAGGTFECALYALEFQVACNIAGGTHHSFADRGEGFCIFNDIAIASNMLLQRNIVKSILVVDLDVHQGNGTARIFENHPQVFTFSMHGAKNYPTRKENSGLDIGLNDHTRDDEYLKILENTLPRLIDNIQPDIIFYQSGVDVLESDKLGRLSMSMRGCAERDRFVFKTAKLYKIPIVAVMGGGYSPKLSDVINAHANTYKMAMDIFY